jgi:hypothetical protein
MFFFAKISNGQVSAILITDSMHKEANMNETSGVLGDCSEDLFIAQAIGVFSQFSATVKPE